MHLLDRSNRSDTRPARHAALWALLLLGGAGSTGCYHPVYVAGAEPLVKAQLDSLKVAQKIAPRCNGYYLLVENALPRAVEIYEVGQHMSERLVAYAQIGYTEVPMTESSQQFIAMSRGELMAAATNTDQRAGDRVALQRSCRPF